MTTNQVKQIIEYKNRGTTISVIADLVGCSRSTVDKYLNTAGLVKHNPPERHRPIAMILHDWNAGTSSQTLYKKYGFKSIRVLYTTISWYRGHGYRFAFRNRPERNEVAG